MDIKRMHDMIEKLSETAKCEFDKGIENVDACEMGQVTDMLKDLAEAMYYRTLTKAMDEAEDDEIMEMFDRYGDGRRFYDHYRYSDGRFAPKGRGSYRRGYDGPYWRMTPEMYKDMQEYRDMDRNTGRMYYTEPTMTMSESNYDRAKRGYIETKELHRANTTQDKEAKMRGLEDYVNYPLSKANGLPASLTS